MAEFVGVDPVTGLSGSIKLAGDFYVVGPDTIFIPRTKIGLGADGTTPVDWDGKIAANSGVDIGDVTINNASGAGAVNIQDGGNSVTIDAPVGVPVAIRLSDGTSFITTLPISAAALPLPTGAATSALQTALNALLPTALGGSGEFRVGLATRLDPTNDQVALGAKASGGWTPYKAISLATTNALSVKASPGQVGYLWVTNSNAAMRWLKFYNKASAPTVGTDIPVHTLGLPGGGTAGAGGVVPIPAGIEFTTGIGIAITTGSADGDTGAVAAGEIVVNLGYK